MKNNTITIGPLAVSVGPQAGGAPLIDEAVTYEWGTERAWSSWAIVPPWRLRWSHGQWRTQTPCRALFVGIVHQGRTR